MNPRNNQPGKDRNAKARCAGGETRKSGRPTRRKAGGKIPKALAKKLACSVRLYRHLAVGTGAMLGFAWRARFHRK